MSKSTKPITTPAPKVVSPQISIPNITSIKGQVPRMENPPPPPPKKKG